MLSKLLGSLQVHGELGSFVRANSYLSMRSDFTRVHLQSVSLSPLCMLTAGRGVWRVQEGISVWNLKQESADLLSLCLLWGKLIGTPEGGSQSSQLVRKAMSHSEPHRDRLSFVYPHGCWADGKLRVTRCHCLASKDYTTFIYY